MKKAYRYTRGIPGGIGVIVVLGRRKEVRRMEDVVGALIAAATTLALFHWLM